MDLLESGGGEEKVSGGFLVKRRSESEGWQWEGLEFVVEVGGVNDLEGQ